MIKNKTEDLRLDPRKRICPKFDETSIALFPVAGRVEISVQVLDNCAEEHINVAGNSLAILIFDNQEK